MKAEIKDIVENVYKTAVVISLLYIGYEINSLKKLSVKNKDEINFVTSKLDYVTSDINLKQVHNRH